MDDLALKGGDSGLKSGDRGEGDKREVEGRKKTVKRKFVCRLLYYQDGRPK